MRGNARRASGWRAFAWCGPTTRGDEKAPTAALRKLAVHDAEFSRVRIVTPPEADDGPRRIRRYGTAGGQPRDFDRL
jgi:hypothetical protein